MRESVTAALPVNAAVVPLDDAMGISSLRAVFGESYPDPVGVAPRPPPPAAL